MWLLTGLKAKLLLLGTALLGLLAAIAKYYKEKSDRLEDENEKLEAEMDFQDDLRTLEVQNDELSKARRKRSEKEMADGKVPSVFKRHT